MDLKKDKHLSDWNLSRFIYLIHSKESFNQYRRIKFMFLNIYFEKYTLRTTFLALL